MLEYFVDFVERFGYLAVALLVALEGLGIPLPGETAVVAAAAVAAQGSLSIVGVVLSAILGTVVGGSGGYWIGRAGGRGFLVRHGHFVRLTAERLLTMERYFERHGTKTVFFARFVALLRIFGSILAGVAHMPFGVFTAVNLAGGIAWAICFGALGFLFGKNLPLLDDYLLEVSIGASLLLVLVLIVYWWRQRRLTANSDGVL